MNHPEGIAIVGRTFISIRNDGAAFVCVAKWSPEKKKTIFDTVIMQPEEAKAFVGLVENLK